MRAPRPTPRPGPEVSPPDELARARACYGRKAWAEAHRAFSRADEATPLAADDLERAAWSANLSGHDVVFFPLMERLYQARLDAGEGLRAARCAFWSGMRLASLKEMGRAGGWFARAQRLVDGQDCVERGYLLLVTVHRSLGVSDYAAAHAAADEAAAIADRFRDTDLGAFARCLQGRALLRVGKIEAGLAHLDEALVAAMTGELGPVITGLIYCGAIAGCRQVYAMDRSREWTAALSSWCADQPELMTFSGTCLIHRAELLELAGSWPEALAEARRASGRVAGTIDGEAAADSLYQEGEVHRLRGDFAAAEEAYRRAAELGREAQPGLALLRLAQGRADDAARAIQRVLDGTAEGLPRARLLPAAVEILLAAGEGEGGRRACEQLERIASAFDTEVLGAMAAHARGAVALADGQPALAVEPLRRALGVWQQVGAPYIAARLRVLVARACQALGDVDSARLERDLARRVFQDLGAAPDLAALEDPAPGATGKSAGGARHGLTPRELEVLRLIATGKTNKAIAKDLFLSEKTIDRHVSNIFTKVNVASRAAATAFAYQRGLA